MKKHMYALIVCMLVIALVGCGKQETKETENVTTEAETTDKTEVETTENTEKKDDTATEEKLTYTDALEQTIEFDKEQLAGIQDGSIKVGILSGSFAEIWSIAGGKLSAVTEDAYDDTREIKIEEDAVNAGTLQSPNLEKLLEGDIKYVMLSADTAEQVAMKDALQTAGITPIYQSIETFEDYLGVLKFYTDLTGQADNYEKYGTSIQSEIDTQIARQDDSHPSVLFIRAFSTGAKAKGSDNMTGIMLKDLGCVNIADNDEVLLDDLSMEKIIEQDPQYIFVTTMGESEEAALKSVKTLLQDNPAWNNLSAVKNDHYYVLPKNMFHNKPNQRWGESYKMLADYLYPEKTNDENK